MGYALAVTMSSPRYAKHPDKGTPLSHHLSSEIIRVSTKAPKLSTWNAARSRGVGTRLTKAAGVSHTKIEHHSRVNGSLWRVQYNEIDIEHGPMFKSIGERRVQSVHRILNAVSHTCLLLITVRYGTRIARSASTQIASHPVPSTSSSTAVAN
jgi:hypothetical protein